MGEGGADNLKGDIGDDIVSGGDGNDFIRGGRGDDIYVGGDGDDFVVGEQGAKQFLFSATEDDTVEQDIINAFDVETDTLILAAFAFLDDYGSIKGKNLTLKLGENHELKIKNIVQGDFAGAQPSDFFGILGTEGDLPEGITFSDSAPKDMLDLGDGFYLPLVPLAEIPEAIPEEETVTLESGIL